MPHLKQVSNPAVTLRSVICSWFSLAFVSGCQPNKQHVNFSFYFASMATSLRSAFIFAHFKALPQGVIVVFHFSIIRIFHFQLHHRARRLFPDAVRPELQQEVGLLLPGRPLAGVLCAVRTQDQHGHQALFFHRVW